MVRTYNMRHIHFSRNPKIAAFLRDYKVVKEFGEGVDRMFREMEEAGQPDPKYIQDDFILKATLKAKEHVEDNVPHENDGKKATAKSDGKKATAKSDGKLTNITQQQVNKLLEAMEPGKKYKSGELCEVLGLKETRMKEILRLLVNLGKIHTDGTFRDRTYSLNDEN